MGRHLPDLRRHTSFRAPKRKFLIVTEGKNTEPVYFEEINRAHPGALVELDIVRAAGVPLSVAKRAIQEKARIDHDNRRLRNTSSHSLNDEVWAAFDRDEHHDIETAIAMCTAAGVGVAFSNPCFELWLILHYRDFDRPYDRHEVQREFAKLCDTYKKSGNKIPNCAQLAELLPQAEQRAEVQMKRRQEENNERGAPSTTVHHLTQSLKDATLNYKAVRKPT